jgi:hypothetical protein
MWIFTGRGNMVLTGNESTAALPALAATGVAEGGADGGEVPPEEYNEELTSLIPTLQKIEHLLRRMDAENAPLLARFSNVFRRYLELNPVGGAAEIMGFLESVERKLATLAETRAGATPPLG